MHVSVGSNVAKTLNEADEHKKASISGEEADKEAREEEVEAWETGDNKFALIKM